MKFVLIATAIVCAVCAQVTVAPLFPLGSAIPDLALITLVLVAAFAGPRPAMVALPVLAVLLSFLSGRSPALLLIAYLPVLPLARALEDPALLLPAYPRLALATVVGGLWARLALSLGAFADGATFAPGTLAGGILLPGAVLDWALLTAAYLPWRLWGREAHLMDLRGAAR